MKEIILASIFLLCVKSNASEGEDICKNMKSCSDWATSRTGVRYELGKLEKRNLKLEKGFNLNEGEADFLFNFILQSNDYLRIKRENNLFQIIQSREAKEFQFPEVKIEEIPVNNDYYLCTFNLSNKEKVKNAIIVIKKSLSKYGRILEVSDSPKIQIVETGINLNSIKLMITELNR